MKIEINSQFKQILKHLNETDESLFVTGNAGTGKSVLLNLFTNDTKKNVAIIAPTGVAAVNVGGSTIHSFFGFAPNVNSEDIYKFPATNEKRQVLLNLDTLVIDEISMVRADIMDAIDKSLRINRDRKDEPFGGVQMVYFGDLLQLPPVLVNDEKESFNFLYESPFFFSSVVIQQNPIKRIALEKVYRQEDEAFLEILNAMRTRSMTPDNYKRLNQQVMDMGADYSDHIYLSTTNKIAEGINSQRLMQLKGKEKEFKADVWGDFKSSHSPVLESITLKIGARVMLQNNDKEDRWVNGTMATVMDFVDEPESGVVVQLDEGTKFFITPHSWDMYKYEFNKNTKQIQTETVGSFSQLPLKLAWAVTIHKSQGKTFEKIIIDLGYGAFAHGQTYVALSRCTSLSGVVLKNFLRERDVIIDKRVVDWLNAPPAVSE
jgi:ATP-dependent DNA helicase PIF1